MGLRQAASLGFVQAVVGMAAAFASVKVTSVFLGPAGIGVLSQFQYMTSIVLGFAAGSTNTSIVRLTAEYAGDKQRLGLLTGTVSRLLLGVGAVVALALFILAPWLAQQLLGDRSWAPAFMLFAAVYLAGLLHSFVLALANGSKDFRAVTLINISAVLMGLVMFVVLCPLYGLAGALGAAAATPLVTAAVALFWSRKKPWMTTKPLQNGFSREEMKRFLSFVPMTLAFALLPNASQVWVRDLLAAEHGWAAVGLTQGVSRLSDMYLNIIITVLSMYYLPRFAEIRLAADLRRELARGLALIVPAVALISAGLYLGRDLLIHIIFTPEFLPMRELFAWQMVGNVLRVVSWLFAYVLVARAAPMYMVAFEIVEALVLMGAGALLVPPNGAIGFTQAYAALNAFAGVVSITWVGLMLRRMPAASKAMAPPSAEQADNDRPSP